MKFMDKQRKGGGGGALLVVAHGGHPALSVTRRSLE
jgi:hypothetical protein